MAPDHGWRCAKMFFETLVILATLFVLTGMAWGRGFTGTALLLGLLQGFWMQRLYVVGHEAAHEKLLPTAPRANALLGQLVLLFILVPLPVFRKIHRFHHGSNRRDVRTSALDTYVIAKNDWLHRGWARALWFLAILGGGWFWHSVVSIVLFLALPVRVAEKISPAFRGWTPGDRLRSIAVFALALALHGGLVHSGGWGLWGAVVGWPLLVFSWVYSIQLYVYHYGTTIGPKVTLHARRLHGPGIGWWLLNLNEHDTHHRQPRVVWYALPEAAEPLPEGYAQNQNVHTFVQGVRQQLRGPHLVVEGER